MERPKPINKEIELDPKRYIVSKTDSKGFITYGNDYFVEISGYKESELVGKPHNIIRHPDMPQVIFKLMWDRIQTGQQMVAVVKNLAKDGRYYWVYTEFESKKDKLTNKIISYTAYRKAAPAKAVATIEPIYTKLLEIEAESGMSGSRNYFIGFLEDRGVSYDEFINSLIEDKGVMKTFFSSMKKLFG
jgi:PAS domain S-box-containing protein